MRNYRRVHWALVHPLCLLVRQFTLLHVLHKSSHVPQPQLLAPAKHWDQVERGCKYLKKNSISSFPPPQKPPNDSVQRCKERERQWETYRFRERERERERFEKWRFAKRRFTKRRFEREKRRFAKKIPEEKIPEEKIRKGMIAKREEEKCQGRIFFTKCRPRSGKG